ncbi:MAG: carboxypeptidase-like regulatory domain-containing protein [Terracidiphilus sp.]
MCAALFALAIAAVALPARAGAQQPGFELPAGVAEPGGAAGALSAPAQRPVDPRSNGALYGTVLDSNGGIVSGATVDLSGPASSTTTSDASGNFSFTHLPSGTFSVKVSRSGMSPRQVPDVVLRPGGVRFLPPVVLQVAAATTIKVYANPEQLAEEQLQLQMNQKVMGFLPNYYSSYDWNAVHLWPKQKFKVSFRSEIDPITFVIIAGEAGVDQFYGRFSSYGGGVAGYAKRYGADYATGFIGTMIGDAILPSLLHQDPRYFYKGTGGTRTRVLYAISRALIVRGDNGHPQFAYSRIMGDLAAGGIANAYYPPESRGVRLVLSSAAVDIGANAATNLIREFILPGLTSHVPKGVKEKSPIHF